MAMGAEKEILEKKVEDEFYRCDMCSYTDGFHTSLKKVGDQLEIYLICPQCHQRYRIGWKINVSSEY